MSRTTQPPVPRRSLLATALVVAVAAPAQAHAQTASPPAVRTFDPVEVRGETVQRASSPKFTAPLRDTPQTVSVVPADVFNAQGARDLTDVLRNTPGISFDAGENAFSSNDNNFSLRGFDTSGSIFIDGVRDSGNYSRDVFNIEQVEVVKGPAADNGRGGLGGYVNLVTKTPQLGYFVRATTSFGVDETDAHARSRGTVDINQQLGDSSALRLNVLAQDGGVVGRSFAKSDAVGIAPSLAFGLGTETRFTLAAQYMRQSGRPDWGVPGASIEDTVNYDPIAGGADRDAFYGLHTDDDDTSARSALARIEHDFRNGLTLSNQTRWAETDRTAVFTVPFGYNPDTAQVIGQTQAYQRENRTLSNQTGLSTVLNTGAVAHTLSAGIELSREESDALRFATSMAPTTHVRHPDYLRAAAPLPDPVQSNRVRIDTVAAYLYDTVRLGEQWQITGGVRAERYDVEIGSTNLLTGRPQGPDGYDTSDTSLSGKLGVVYKPDEHASLYASVGIATLPPGAFLSNPDISRTGNNAFPGLIGQNNDEAKPQRAVNHEIGVKWNFFDDRLATSAAVFQTQRRGVAISGVDPDVAGSPTALRGYGKQVVRGVELAVTGALSDAWSVFAGAVLLDSERQHSAWLDAARRGANPNDYGSFLTTDGDELAFTPKRSANLWSTYTFANGLTLGGGLQHVGDSWAGRPDDADRIIPNGRYGKLPGDTVGNLMVSYTLSDALTLRLNIDNVTDETYATSMTWAMTRGFLGPSRNYLFSADFRF